MFLTDELVTPGCPQCFVKHMSAAVAYIVECAPVAGAHRYAWDVLVARAAINLREVANGYRSHLDYAIGLLVMAEDAGYSPARKVRLDLELDPSAESAEYAASALMDQIKLNHVAMACGHLLEAEREFPVYAARVLQVYNEPSKEAAVAAASVLIADVRREYFELPDVQSGGEGGEEDMACKKTAAPAKPAKPAKAAQAACKGGKTKKKCK